MSKLLDMFSQARRGQSGGGMGFLGKNKTPAKPHAAALVVELSATETGSAEAAIKAGADGLLFTWNGKGDAPSEELKQTIAAARTTNENIACGLHIQGGWEQITRPILEDLKEQGLNYVILPLSAPARLLGMRVKDLDMIVTVPMREGELYPVFIRNLSAFETITAIHLDFELGKKIGNLSIEDIIHYRAVRDALRAPALINVPDLADEAEAYTLVSLGIQGLILSAHDSNAATTKQVQKIRELLEKVYQEEKDATSPSPSLPGRS